MHRSGPPTGSSDGLQVLLPPLRSDMASIPPPLDTLLQDHQSNGDMRTVSRTIRSDRQHGLCMLQQQRLDA